MYACMYACMCVCVNVCMYVYMYVSIDACVYVCMYNMYVCTYAQMRLVGCVYVRLRYMPYMFKV